MKKLKASNGNEDNGMVAYMEEALKNKFEEFGDQEETSKLFFICSISKDHSKKQLKEENWVSVGEEHPTADGSPAPTVVGRFLDKKAKKFLPYHRRVSFLESIDLWSSNFVIRVLRSLFPQGSN
ncbi:hypothetical protein M9H77_26747 [Catharanthus roseus]|uniref:Uncharacterized protein n=1 Tax=Catharanthus roseus TaxID=4058 RepID=A0ACC0AAW1_CATRO|nr:hypothetical protein M9H77_26747 [Catharanthus roseus]